MMFHFLGSAVRRTAGPVVSPARADLAGSVTVYTETGPVAARYLEPGDRIVTRQTAGSAVVTHVAVSRGSVPLVRVAPDTLGRARPEDFILLHPLQRVILRAAAGAPRDGTVLARDLVAERLATWHTPPEPAFVVHLTLDRPTTMHAGGLELDIPG